MFKRNALRFLMALLSLFALAGCGEGDSQTSGLLNLNVSSASPTGGLFVINAQASYVASTGGPLEGFPIKITFTARRLDGTVVTTVTRDLRANTAGSVSASLDVTQINEVIVVSVVASSGGLADQDTVVVPSIAAMTSTPAVVAFPAGALANDTQTVIISGGTAPYNPQISAPGDFQVTVNGNAITLRKLRNSVTNGPALSATLTVDDSSSATTPIDITVSYF